MALFCMNCGKEIPAGAKFCPACGSPSPSQPVQQQPPIQQPAQQPVQQPPYQQAPYQQPAPYPGYDPNMPPTLPPKKKSNAGIIVLITLLALAALGAGGWALYKYVLKPSAPVENNEPSTSFSSEEEQHITRPGVFIKSLGNGEFCGTLSEVSDFAGDEGGYSNRECTIIVDKVDGEYKVVNIYNYMKKRYEL